MVVFACAGCGAVMTAKVARVALPDHSGQKYGHDLLPGLLEPGTYVVDPGDGRPWAPWEPEPEEHGVRRQAYRITGPPNRIGIAPGDVRGTVFIPERLGGCCCGWDGQYGPIAGRSTSCSLQGRRPGTSSWPGPVCPSRSRTSPWYRGIRRLARYGRAMRQRWCRWPPTCGRTWPSTTFGGSCLRSTGCLPAFAVMIRPHCCRPASSGLTGACSSPRWRG